MDRVAPKEMPDDGKQHRVEAGTDQEMIDARVQSRKYQPFFRRTVITVVKAVCGLAIRQVLQKQPVDSEWALRPPNLRLHRVGAATR